MTGTFEYTTMADTRNKNMNNQGKRNRAGGKKNPHRIFAQNRNNFTFQNWPQILP